MMVELNKLLGIQTKLSTAYHPQTDGQTERANQEIEQYLRLFVDHRQHDWPEWLALAEFAHNNSIHSSTSVTPFYASYGLHPRMGIEPNRTSKNEAASEFAGRMKRIHEEAQAALIKARDEMKRYADQTRGETPEYKVGQKVWLETTDLAIKRPSKKLAEKRIGPYPILEIISKNAVKLKLPKSIHIHPVVNVSRIRPYNSPRIHGQKRKPPPPVEIDGEQEYEVEKILDSRLYRGKLEYLVKWEGYTDEWNNWNKPEDMQHAQEAIDEFHQKYPSAPRRIYFMKKDHFKLAFKPYINFTNTPDDLFSRLETEIGD